MELERFSIERTDFPAARRGYDPDEVDAHLRELADAVEDLQHEQSSGASLAGQAADQVRAIVEAAENSATEMQSKAAGESERLSSEAEAEAARIRSEADEAARNTRQQAQQDAAEAREAANKEAAEHVHRAQEAADKMLTRAKTIETELDDLVHTLRGTADELVGKLRAGASSVASELDEVRASVPDLRAREADVGEVAVAAEPDEGAAATSVGDPVSDDIERIEAEEDDDGDVLEVAADEASAEDDELEAEETDEDVADDAAAEEEDELVADDEPAEAAVHEPVEEAGGDGAEGARLIALNMALNGTAREETATYLAENFDLDDPDSLLDDVYDRVGG